MWNNSDDLRISVGEKCSAWKKTIPLNNNWLIHLNIFRKVSWRFSQSATEIRRVELNVIYISFTWTITWQLSVLKYKTVWEKGLQEFFGEKKNR